MISSPRENLKQGNEDERETLEMRIELPGKVMLTLSNENPVRETEAPDDALS